MSFQIDLPQSGQVRRKINRFPVFGDVRNGINVTLYQQIPKLLLCQLYIQPRRREIFLPEIDLEPRYDFLPVQSVDRIVVPARKIQMIGNDELPPDGIGIERNRTFKRNFYKSIFPSPFYQGQIIGRKHLLAVNRDKVLFRKSQLFEQSVRQPAFIPEIALYTAMNQFVGLIGIDDQFFPVGIDHEIRHSDILPGPSADPANIP